MCGTYLFQNITIYCLCLILGYFSFYSLIKLRIFSAIAIFFWGYSQYEGFLIS